MKHLSKRVLGIALITMTLGGCDFITPTETDPNAVPSATVDQLFTGIQVNTFFQAGGQISRLASMWVQQMAGTDRQFVALDDYIITESDADDDFERIYTGGGLIDIRNAITQAEDAGRQVYAGILRIHEAYLFGMAASFWGDIPYSEAANPDITEPALDGQAAVYAAIQTLLDAAIADLATGSGASPGAIDLNFGGSAASWTAVANTIKARLHMHWGEANPGTAYALALTAAASGISSASDDWKAIHSTSATENNLWYQFERDRSGYISAGDHLVPLMDNASDPRTGVYFGLAPAGGYVARESSLSPTGYGSPAWDFPIVTCAENSFIIAEAEFTANGNEPAAIAAAQAGLACAEDDLGVDLSAEQTAIGLLAGAALFDAIMDQKYIAMFLNAEAWNDYKRTCRPVITERPGGMPGRFFYGQQERQTNSNIPDTGSQPARNANDPAPC